MPRDRDIDIMKRIQRDRPLLGEMVMLGTSHVLIVPTSMSSVPRREHLNRITLFQLQRFMGLVGTTFSGLCIHAFQESNMDGRESKLPIECMGRFIYPGLRRFWTMDIPTSIV